MRGQVDMGHVEKVFREPIRGFCDLLRRKPPSFLIQWWSSISKASIRMRSIYLVFRGEDESIAELNAVSLVNNEFSYG
jgi:hypothetical protein